MRRTDKKTHRMYSIGKTCRRLAINGEYPGDVKPRELKVGDTLVLDQEVYCHSLDDIKALPVDGTHSRMGDYSFLFNGTLSDGTEIKVCYAKRMMSILCLIGDDEDYSGITFKKDNYGYYFKFYENQVPLTITEDKGGLALLRSVFDNETN